ncbi:MAG: ABC transporter permease [Eubacterium sp.]|nr:ABC transporter permease [Eubacterium sp.]
MYAKLIFKNARRSIKEYLIYLVTMTICTTLFYAFLSISSAYYHPAVGSAYDLTILGDDMKLAVCAVTLLLVFLIRYVNHYMLMHRQREFAIHAVMGMEQRTIGWLFFAETLCMGAVSILLGIFLGMVGSQFITAMLLSDYGADYQFSWMLFPDTVLLTVSFFSCCLLLVGIFNMRAIQKIKLADMLAAQRRNAPSLRKSRFLHVLTFFYVILLGFMLFSSLQMITCYFDPRLALPVHILFWGIILAPALGILLPIVWLAAYLLRKKKPAFHRFILAETAVTCLNAIGAACVPIMKSHYLLAYGSGVMKQYLMYLIVNVIFFICELIYLSSLAAAAWKERSPQHRYKGENLFFYGQILSKLADNTKSMILICITLVLSFFLFIAAPVLTEWSLGYLHDRCVYDILISSSYNKVYEEQALPQGDYSVVTEFLTDNNISTAYDHTFSLYLPKRSQFRSRVKWEFPVLAVSLSDYNAIREMLGYPPISLAPGTFTTQWQSIATDDERNAFLQNHPHVSTDMGSLTLSDDAFYEISVGEHIYNLYTDVIYVFPDDVCKNLLGVKRERYIQTAHALSYADAQAMETAFLQAYPDTAPSSDSSVQYDIRLQTMETNRILMSNFILKASMIYGAIVLMVICLTILSLQQLMDASQYQYRFFVLRRLGVEEQNIKKLILKQLGMWFGLPVALALLVCVIVSGSFLQTISAQIDAYIGAETLLTQLGITIGILFLLLICYFISTWILFRHSVKPGSMYPSIRI